MKYEEAKVRIEEFEDEDVFTDVNISNQPGGDEDYNGDDLPEGLW